MEVISSDENYPGSQRLEDTVQSLYADEQPKRRLKSKVAHSKLADTVGIENNIMLNVEDLAKATVRSAMNNSGEETSRDHNEKNSGQQGRQTRTYVGSGRRRGSATRRQTYESRTSPGNDVNLGNASAESRTSVIRGLPPPNRKPKPTSSESDTEEANAGETEDVEKMEYGHLRCYEQFEKESGNAAEILSGRGNYLQSTKEERMETSRNSASHADGSMTQDRISENLARGPVTGARYPISAVDGRLYAQAANVFHPAHAVHDMNAQYRIQHPPEFPMSQAEQRGKQFFDRGGLPPASASGHGIVHHSFALNPHGKFGVPDGLFVQTHADLANTYAGYSRFETRSPSSSTSSGKDRELLPDQEPVKNNVQRFPSPVGSIRDEHGQTPPIPNSLSQQKAPDEIADDNKLDGNKNIKEKRGKSENANQCEQCWKTFASSSALAKHKLTHSDERQFVCSICAKGFKRQDHLKGHMLTHRDKKPYECKFVHCDKSYCDMRSLRRHIENYHPNHDGAQSVASSAGISKQDTEQASYKVNSGQHRNQCLTPDVEEGSPKSIQEIGHHGKSKQEMSQGGRKRNSDSMCSNNSEDSTRRSDSHSPHQPQSYEKPTSAANMLKQIVEHAPDSKGEKQVMDNYPRSGYYQYQDGSNSQWYHPFSQQMIQMYQVNSAQVPMLVSQSIGPYHAQLRKNAYCPGDPPQMVPSYPFVSQSQASRGNEKNIEDRTNLVKIEEDGYHGMRYRDSGAPPDPTMIAIVNAKDHPKELRFKEGNPVVQWKTVPVHVKKESSGMSPFSMGNNPVSMQYNPVSLGMQLPDSKVSREQPPPLKINIPTNQTEKRCQEMVDIDHQPPLAKRHCHVATPPLNTGEEWLLKIGDGSMRPPSSTECFLEEVFRNPPSTPPRKCRPKPDPIHIPCSTLSGHPMSPPIYTPPPMLSPRSIFNITPRCGGTTPLTPGRFFLGNRSRKNSLDGVDTDQQEIILPEPKINIGTQFQAEIPVGVAPRKLAEFDKNRVAVCWIPFENETKKRSQEIEAFLDMACSVAVHGGGSNKEYALHVLYRLRGNIKLAVKHILANKTAIQKEDGLADYHYKGSDRWSAKERLKFREALTLKGKNFFQISKEVETKCVAQCVEFYYLWKAIHPEAMRSRTRYAETESESETIEYFSDDGNSTLVFECDFPECNSKFISRQALNGHIRVHGGSFMKPSEPKRTKVKTTTNSDNNNTTVSVSTSVNRPATKPTKPPPPPASTTNGDEPLPEFACKVCGRIFHKIKSRSAHMKTHVKRSEDGTKL